MDNLHVLLVDDDPDVAVMMKMMLSHKAPELSVEVAYSGPECLEYIETTAVDCIVSDFQMPRMDGIELLQKLRETGNDAPFIFLTGQGNEELAREAFKLGAYDYFTKDVGFAHFDRITNSIHQAVSQRKAKKDREEADRYWEDTFNAIDDLITLHDSEFTIRLANRATCDMLGESPESLKGRKCYELFHHLDQPIDNCPARELVDGKVEIITHTVDVMGNQFEVKVCPILDKSGLKAFVHVAKPTKKVA